MSGQQKKQEFLRENIMNKGYDAETFISFLESKREDGSNIEAWSLAELEEMVKEFQDEISKGSIIKKTADEESKANVFGEEKEQEGSDESKDEDSSDDDSDDKSQDGQEPTEEETKDAKQDSSDEEEEMPASKSKKKKQSQKKIKKKNKKKTVKKTEVSDSSSSSSSSSSSDDEDMDEKDQVKLEQKKKLDKKEKESKYYSKRTVARYMPTELVGKGNITVDVSNPEIVKGKSLGLKTSYTVYTIKCTQFDWEVKRRYSDFDWLYNCLVKRFPANYVRLRYLNPP